MKKFKHLKTFENYEGNSTKSIRESDFFGGSIKETWELFLKSRDSGWYGEELQETTECARIGNGWLSSLSEMSNDNPEISNVLKMIEKNRFDLWEDNLEDTFECILMEDLKGDNGELVVEYSGWVEELEKLV